MTKRQLVKSIQLVCGWYVPQQIHSGRRARSRWILRIETGRDGKRRVYYSRGGDSHHFCRETTFIKWMRKMRITSCATPMTEAPALTK